MQQGASGGFTASLTTGRRYGNDPPEAFLSGPFGVNLGYGWQPDNLALPAARIATHAWLGGVQLDGYVQALHSEKVGLDAGVGYDYALGDKGRVRMPYIQAGRISPAGTGWFAGYGYYTNRDNYDPRGPTRLSKSAQVPMIGYEHASGELTTYFIAAAAIGHQFILCRSYEPPCRVDKRNSGILQITFELHKRYKADAKQRVIQNQR